MGEGKFARQFGRGMVPQIQRMPLQARGGGRDVLSEIRIAGERRREDERLERAVTDLGKRIESSGITKVAGVLQTAIQDLPREGEAFKSYGTPELNAMPTSMIALLERQEQLPRGALNERQAMEAMKALVRHPLYGATLTRMERESFESAFGAPWFAQGKDVHRAIARMKKIPVTQLRNIEATVRPKALEKFKARGGQTSIEIQEIFKPKPDTERPMRTAPPDISVGGIAKGIGSAFTGLFRGQEPQAPKAPSKPQQPLAPMPPSPQPGPIQPPAPMGPQPAPVAPPSPLGGLGVGGASPIDPERAELERLRLKHKR